MPEQKDNKVPLHPVNHHEYHYNVPHTIIVTGMLTSLAGTLLTGLRHKHSLHKLFVLPFTIMVASHIIYRHRHFFIKLKNKIFGKRKKSTT